MRGKYRVKAAGTQESEQPQSTLLSAIPQVGHAAARMSACVRVAGDQSGKTLSMDCNRAGRCSHRSDVSSTLFESATVLTRSIVRHPHSPAGRSMCSTV